MIRPIIWFALFSSALLHARRQNFVRMLLWCAMAAFIFIKALPSFRAATPVLLALWSGDFTAPTAPTAPVPPSGNWANVPPGVARWQVEIEQAAAKCGVDALLVAAIMTQESGGDPTVCSNMGACGLMQLMPATAREVNVSDRLDANQSIQGGACYYSKMAAQYGEQRLALAAYNAGPANVDRYGDVPPFHETQMYVHNVTAYYQQYSSGALGMRLAPPMRGARLVKAFGVPVAYQIGGKHTGLDIVPGIDQGIYAVGNGVIEYVGPLYGNAPGKFRGSFSILLRLDNGLYATYSHNSYSYVKAGQMVQAGQKIALVGSEGYSSGVHLHFEICKGCTWTDDWTKPFSPQSFDDPEKYLRGNYEK